MTAVGKKKLKTCWFLLGGLPEGMRVCMLAACGVDGCERLSAPPDVYHELLGFLSVE